MCFFLSFPVQVQEQTKEPRKNPFLRKKRAVLSEPFLLRTVQQIPGVGKVKAPLLLQKFPSIQQLSNASIQELESVVGQVVAQQIHAFFTQSRWLLASCLCFLLNHQLQDLVFICKKQEKVSLHSILWNTRRSLMETEVHCFALSVWWDFRSKQQST